MGAYSWVIDENGHRYRVVMEPGMGRIAIQMWQQTESGEELIERFTLTDAWGTQMTGEQAHSFLRDVLYQGK